MRSIVIMLCLAAGLAPAATVITILPWQETLPGGVVLSLTGGTAPHPRFILALTATEDTTLSGSANTGSQVIDLPVIIDGTPTTVPLFSNWGKGPVLAGWTISFLKGGSPYTRFPDGSYLASSGGVPTGPIGTVASGPFNVWIEDGGSVAPEPSMMALAGAGLSAIALLRRRIRTLAR